MKSEGRWNWTLQHLWWVREKCLYARACNIASACGNQEWRKYTTHSQGHCLRQSSVINPWKYHAYIKLLFKKITDSRGVNFFYNQINPSIKHFESTIMYTKWVHSKKSKETPIFKCFSTTWSVFPAEIALHYIFLRKVVVICKFLLYMYLPQL